MATIAKNNADKAHLFYVEDDESLSFVTRDNLEIAGYLVTHVSDGQDAFGRFEGTAQQLIPTYGGKGVIDVSAQT